MLWVARAAVFTAGKEPPAVVETRPAQYDALRRRAYVLHKANPERDTRVDEDRPDRKHEAEALHVRAYFAPNWFTADGVLRKRRRIEAKGMPVMHLWRFLTLTIDPELFAKDPLSAFLAGRKRMTLFIRALFRHGIFPGGTKWAWKIEFHRSGWPHWHMLVGYKRKLSVQTMQKITELWQLGIVEHRMVNEKKGGSFDYAFKYAFKPSAQESEDPEVSGDETVPDWFLDYVGAKLVEVRDEDGSMVQVQKPETFGRIRLWQTSKGFYTGDKPKESEKKDPVSCIVPLPARDILTLARSKVVACARSSGGSYIASAVISLSCPAASFWDAVRWDSLHGGAVGLGVKSYVVPAYLLKRNTESPCLKPLLNRNHLNLRGAERLQRERTSLLTC